MSRAVPSGLRNTEVPVDRSAFDHYFVGKRFSVDWTSWHFPNWARCLASKRRIGAEILEIGSFEGRSAVFFLNYLLRSRIVCIDTFLGNAEHLDPQSPTFADMLQVEQRFDLNMREYADRCEKITGLSIDELPKLAFANRRFDLIYVDGDHRAAGAYRDACLAWPLLVQGGLMIFDDYLWKPENPELERPKLGIDAFLKTNIGNYKILHSDYQIIVEKMN